MASLFDKLKSAVKGVGYQLRTGDRKTFADAFREDEEERRRKRLEAQRRAQELAAQQRAQAQARTQRQGGGLRVDVARPTERISLTNDQPKNKTPSLTVEKPKPQPTINVPKPQVQQNAVSQAVEEFRGFSLDKGQNKKLFGKNAAWLLPKSLEKTYGVRVDDKSTVKTTRNKMLTDFDNLDEEFRRTYVAGLNKRAGEGDELAKKTLRTLEENGRFKGNAMDFISGSNERFGGGMARGTLRIIDKVLPGKNTLGLEELADDMETARQYTRAGKAGEKFGTAQKGITDLATIVAPTSAVDKAVKGTSLIKKLEQGSRIMRSAGYVGRVVPGSLVGSGIDVLQEAGRGNDPNIARSAGIGLGIDVATPAVLDAAGRVVNRYRRNMPNVDVDRAKREIADMARELREDPSQPIVKMLAGETAAAASVPAGQKAAKRFSQEVEDFIADVQDFSPNININRDLDEEELVDSINRQLAGDAEEVADDAIRLNDEPAAPTREQEITQNIQTPSSTRTAGQTMQFEETPIRFADEPNGVTRNDPDDLISSTDRFPQRLPGESDRAYSARLRGMVTPSQTLPEVYDGYFDIDEATQLVPLEALQATKPGQESSANAAKLFMEAAANGQMPRRSPVVVREIAPGQYQVIDGNATLAAAQQMGWKNLPVKIDNDFNNYDDDMIRAAMDVQDRATDADDIFHEGIETAAQRLGLEYRRGPVKKGKRILEKAVQDYNGDFDRVLDVNRGTMTIDDPASVQNVIEALGEQLEVVRVKNGFELTDRGYKDIKVNVRMPNGSIGEVIVTTPEMLRAKNELGGHALYVQARSTVDADEFARLEEEMFRLYDEADSALAMRLASSSEISVPSTSTRAGGTASPDTIAFADTLDPSDSIRIGESSSSKNLTNGSAIPTTIPDNADNVNMPMSNEKTGIFNEYDPSQRLNGSQAENTPLTQFGYDPDQIVTVYRGVPNGVTTINDGDWVTTNPQLARDYAGTGDVISQDVPARDLFAEDGDDALEELVYSAQRNEPSLDDPLGIAELEAQMARSQDIEEKTAIANELKEIMTQPATADNLAARISRVENGAPQTADEARAAAERLRKDIIDAEKERILEENGIQRAEVTQLLRDIRAIGGINPQSVDSEIPLSVRRRGAPQSADYVAQELRSMGYQFDDEADLLETLNDIYMRGQTAKLSGRDAAEIAEENLRNGTSPYANDFKGIDAALQTQIDESVDYVKELRDLHRTIDTKFQGDLERSFIKTVQGAEGVTDELAGSIAGSYNRVSNEEAIARAQKRVKDVLNDPNGSVDELENFTFQNINAEGAATGRELLKHYQANRQFDKAGDLAEALAQRFTEAGQFVQAARLYQELTPEAIVQRTANAINRLKTQYPQNKNIQAMRVSPDFQENVVTKMDEIKKLPDGDYKDLKVHQLREYVARQIPSTFAEKATSIYKANLLTAVTTSLGAVIGNTGRGSLKIATDAVAATLDIGAHYLTGAARTRAFTLRGMLDGSAEGLRRARQYIKTGYDPRNPLNKFDMKQVFFSNTKKGRAAEAYVNTVFRTMGALDQPFYYAAFKNDLYQQAIVAGRNKKLSGQEFKKFVADYVDQPNDAALEMANTRAREAVFQQDTALGNAAGAFKRGLSHGVQGERDIAGQAGKMIGESIIPFTKIPAAVAMTAIDFSPAGLGGEILKQIYNKNFDQAKFIEAISKTAVGTGGVMAAGNALYENGMLTLHYPSDKKEQELWELEGKQEFSIKVGGKWRSLNYVQPFGALLAAGAAAGEQDDANIIERGAAGMQAIGASVLEQSFLEGVSSAIDVVKKSTDDKEDGVNPAYKWLSRQAGTVVPNIVRKLATAVDPEGGREMNNPIEQIQGGIPFWRNDLIPTRNIFGDPKEKKANGLEIFLDPTRPQRANEDDPLVNELRRLQDAGFGSLPGRMKGKVDFGDEKIRLTPEQTAQAESLINPEIKDAWSKIVASAEYQSATDEEKQKLLDKAEKDIRAVGKIQFADDAGIKISEESIKKLTSDQKSYALTGDYTVNTMLGLPEGLTEQSRNALITYEKLSGDEKDSWLNDGQNEYQYELAKFEKSVLNDELTDIKKFEKLQDLGKLKVQSVYSREARDLYRLSKTELRAYMEEHPVSEDAVNQMLAMDAELAEKGFISSAKYKNGIYGSGSGGGGGGRGGRGKKEKVIEPNKPQFGSFRLVEAPQVPGGDVSDVIKDFNAMVAGLPALQGRVPNESESDIQLLL